jgi:hypothetical protein
MNWGLLLKENSSWTSWIPRYGIKVNGLIRSTCKDHQVSTFEVGLICWWGNDESGVSNEADILPFCKLDPSLYCRHAWAASFYQHSPSRWRGYGSECTWLGVSESQLLGRWAQRRTPPSGDWEIPWAFWQSAAGVGQPYRWGETRSVFEVGFHEAFRNPVPKSIYRMPWVRTKIQTYGLTQETVLANYLWVGKAFC